MPDPTHSDVPRRRTLLGSGLLAGAVFAAAFGLLQVTGSPYALILLLPAMLLVVRTLVGIQRRRGAGPASVDESPSASDP